MSRFFISSLLLCAVALGQSGLLLRGVGASDQSPITLINHGHIAVSGTSATTSSINMTGANFLVAYCTVGQSQAATAVSDSLSNTWSSTTVAVEGTLEGQIFYVSNATVGSSQTFTCTGGSRAAIYVMGFNNVINSSALDQQAQSVWTATSNPSTGSVTPGQNKELLVAASSQSASAGLTLNSVDGGFTIVDSDAGTSTTVAAGIAYLVQTTAAAANPTFTYSGGASFSMGLIATFKHN